jgi:hypothetical protein
MSEMLKVNRQIPGKYLSYLLCATGGRKVPKKSYWAKNPLENDLKWKSLCQENIC